MAMTAAAPALPRLREDLKLHRGPEHRDGSPTWRIFDPVRNRFFEIGWLEFELLARWFDHKSAAALIDHVAAETPLQVTEDEVAGFVEFLENNQLLVPGNPQEIGKLRSRLLSMKKPWYEQLLHKYLFFRLPLARPDHFLDRTVALMQPFYTRTFAAIVLVVFMADLYLVSREFDEITRSFLNLLSWQGGFYFALAATFSKIVHEFAHAYTAKRYGVRVPAMGVAFLVMWPFLYTDTAETWKLADRGKQFAIAAAGIVSELVLACFATLLWALTPDGGMKDIYFVLATTTWVMTLAINASPFMRFDGYFLLSDALDFPNLHERSSACARWWLRGTFFKLHEAVPEPTFTPGQRAGLIVFALVTWLYRLVVFIGIALLVYYLFWKPLGIALMIVEILWFIVRPIADEIAYLWKNRKAAGLAFDPLAKLTLLILIIIWLIPVTREITIPGVVLAEQRQEIYAPFPAQTTAVGVRNGQPVKAGEILVWMDSPELVLRAEKSAVSLATAKAEYLRGVATSRQQERSLVLLEKVNEALAEERAVREEIDRLQVRSPADGVVRDMSSFVSPGHWINPRELLMRVVSPQTEMVEAYVRDTQIGNLELGQSATFFPSAGGLPAVEGRIVMIDPLGGKAVPPLLASVYGGEIAAVTDQRGAVVAQHPHYRVLIRLNEPMPTDFVSAGTVRVKTDLVLLAQNFLYRAISLFIRESSI